VQFLVTARERLQWPLEHTVAIRNFFLPKGSNTTKIIFNENKKTLPFIKGGCPIYRGALSVTTTTTVLVIDVYMDAYPTGYGLYPSSDIIQEGVTYLHSLTLWEP
jgi:hypothetical protein